MAFLLDFFLKPEESLVVIRRKRDDLIRKLSGEYVRNEI
jgi:hypothetical protein